MRTGEISSAATFKMMVGIQSGLVALWGFNSHRCFATPLMVLGPLLFLAFINDLPRSTAFADDGLLYRHIKSDNDARLRQQDL